MVKDHQYDLDLDMQDWEADQAYFERAGRSPGSYTSWTHPSHFEGTFVCPHPPQCILKSEADGWEVWAGARFDCLDYLRHFDMILNLSGEAALEGHHFPMKELSRWSADSRPQEAVIDWPDMGVVALPSEFWTNLAHYLAAHKARLLIFCVGGHGRTGTAIACLMVACGWKSDDAIQWIRKNYCSNAIESKVQEAYIREIEAGRLTETQQKQRRSRNLEVGEQGEISDAKETEI